MTPLAPVHRRRLPAQRGVSLIEALVALAVMAFGMLGIVGVQATLRFNSDVAKQRSEAVRLAQQSIEDARSFMLVATDLVVFDYTDIVDLVDQPLTGLTTNTTYYINRRVVTSGSAPDSEDPRMKTLRVTVSWADRTGINQSVELNTVIGQVPPDLAGTLALAANVGSNGVALRGAGGRNAVIPRVSVDLGNGTSGFMPPQASGGNVAWVFNTTTGVITICRSSATATSQLTRDNISNCGSDTAQLLTGFVRFAYSVVSPAAVTAAIAENPTDPALNLDVAVTLTSIGNPAPGSVCYDDAPTTAAVAATRTTVTYYCAVFPSSSGLWSGISTLVPVGLDSGAAWVIPATLPGAGYRVCRYTPTASDTPPNPQHPRTYTDVSAAQLLNNQNFLVIDAGQDCPTDVVANPASGDFVNSNTRQHQPAP